MKFQQAKDFPFCDHYMQYFLEPKKLQERKQLWDAFKEVCADAQIATVGLTYGKGPLVVIGCVPAGRQGKYWSKAKTVYIHPNVANLYERHTHPQPKMWERAKEKHNLLDWMPWEATVLHEIVHWARDVGGKSEDFNGGEAGKAFEVKGYGREISAGATMGQASECASTPTPPWQEAS